MKYKLQAKRYQLSIVSVGKYNFIRLKQQNLLSFVFLPYYNKYGIK